jgi:tRNA dimethylallyltransferase
VDPDESFGVADFIAHVEVVLADLDARQGVAILVGGTGLYLRAILRGLAIDDLPHDPAARARLESDLTAEGLPALAARLEATAPTLASSVDLRNPRRVVRALELAELRGDGPRPTGTPYAGPVLQLGLAIDPAEHRRWIAARAREQFEAGLIDEAAALRERWDPALPAFSAIGYREAWAVLDGDLTVDAAIDLDARRNVAFARRQRTWFRAEPGVEWLDATADPGRTARLRVERFLEP